ncbi:T9SS type B sorting domain-containing protein [Flavobacterium crassostreae]|uniref:DUF11 domain-containing protein n=1 Tax=Flavobacterium crassostreae TaxID=1763534 RepID=A0A1B9E0G9_9FLAO|nr:T9SS type B sorting domain-containing protein [Flavobacterium crassostreae]OCB75445.1 hypothetical protein LPBF_08625 [Flavobacterium crassostreae]
MKKPTFLKHLFICLLVLSSLNIFAQAYVNFSPRYDSDINGDILLIGNSILNRQSIATASNNPNKAYNGGKLNSDTDFNMNYINVSPSAGIFNSSSANLVLPDPTCSKIVYAGLYWSAVTRGTETITAVKFKMPTGNYNDVTGTVIYNAGTGSIGTSKPYACFADVTTLINSLGATPVSGTYTVGNISTAQGKNGGTGLSAGWSLFIVYENVFLPRKSITSFDGFNAIGGSNNLTIPISGFRTIPNGPVKAKFAFSAMEGDLGIGGDYLSINGVKMTPPERPAVVPLWFWDGFQETIYDWDSKDNFFNSSVTSMGAVVTNRNPASTNTLGFDAGVFEIDNPINDPVNNPGGSVLDNNQTSAEIFLGSSQDAYFYYFNALAVEIIAPDIILDKGVTDVNDDNVSNANVQPGDELRYSISFQNDGNDDATNFTITDKLPVNVIFDVNNDILQLPDGVKVLSYDSVTRTIVFSIEDRLVMNSGGKYTIKFRVIVAGCENLADACSNVIKNIAFSKYKGVINPSEFGSDSFAVNVGCKREASSTNFLVGLDNCTLKETVALCGTSIELKAPNGYPYYSWTDPSGVVVGGNNQVITATKTGTYTVITSGANPCIGINKTFEVINPLGIQESNPINAWADNIDPTTGLPFKCVNNLKPLPKIFLCGKNDSRTLNINLATAKSILWQQTTDVNPTLPDSCPNESPTATWTNVATGSNFVADSPGFFRVIINYTDVCLSTFYFNVYQNPLDPKIAVKNNICDTKGSITVTNPPLGSGYKYSIDGINYQDANVFQNLAAGNYTVSIKQIVPVTDPNTKLCEFKVKATILDQVFSVTITSDARHCADKGYIGITANDVNKQYRFVINKEGTTDTVGDSGLIDNNYYNYSGIGAGRYDVIITTADGCYKKEVVDFLPKILKATASITKNLTCENGEITVVASGGTPVVGTPPYYYYFVNGSTVAQTSPIIPIIKPLPPGGNYQIEVVDAVGCRITLPIIHVDEVAKPTYTVEATTLNCSDDKASISFKVTNPNGYTLTYSIDNGATFTTDPVFLNQVAGDYQVVLKYASTATNGVITECLDGPKTITIAPPANSLTASAGVSQLAGCTLSNQGGTIRITNVEGGVTPYTYSFDGGATWQSTNEKAVLPGTYTLLVKDALNCTYTIPYPVILDPVPAAPTITVTTSGFNCDGTATSTVTVTNPGSSNYEYEYFIDGVKNPNTTDPKVFLNVTSGDHQITVNYKLLKTTTYSNLLLETFGYGEDTTSPGISTALYCFERQVVATQCKGSPAINDGDYSVTSFIVNPYGSWVQPGDHTTQTVPPTPKGRSLVVNIGNQIALTDILYQKVINDIIPNQPINFELYAMNLLRNTSSDIDADLRVALVDASGTEISWFATGDIPKSEKWEVYPKTAVTLNPGANTSLKFIIRSNKRATDGNDVAIDDIRVYQLPESCIAKKDFPIKVPTDKKFAASVTGATNLKCPTSNDGTITIAAENFNTVYGFDYSIDNGTNWTNTKTSPVTITGLAAQTYAIKIRYDNLASTCSFDFSQPITAPTPATVTASVTTLPTCITGATITAVASGGTPGYEYELRKTDGTIVVAYTNTAVFSDIALGNYVVVVRDANQCVSAESALVAVTAPNPVVATLDTSVSLCYDGTNKVKLTANVTAGTGTAPFTYSINTGQAPVGNTFEVIPGNYTITVTDANSCTTTITGILVANALKAKVDSVAELRCDTTGAAIVVSITGGTQEYSYTVNGTLPAINLPNGTTTFTYTAPTAGDYKFEIIDSKGCTTSVDAKVNAIVNPTLQATPTQVTCKGANNGTVQLLANGGSGGYTYSKDGITYVGTSLFINLSPSATAYTFYVKDSKGCVGTTTVTITEPLNKLEATVTETIFSCSSSNTKIGGSVVINLPTGGTAPYTYSFNGGNYTSNNTLVINNTTQDVSYTYDVKDKNECTIGGSGILNRLNPPTALSFTPAGAITCGASTTNLTVAATNGVGTLYYETIAPSPIIVAKQTSGTFTNLTPGTYTFRVTDANGCYYTDDYQLKDVIKITVIGNKLKDNKCFGVNIGSLEFIADNYATTYSHSLSLGSVVVTPTEIITNGGKTVTYTGLAKGIYTYTVTDAATNCTASSVLEIKEPATAVTALLDSNVNANCQIPYAVVTITATGGTPNYNYAFVKDGVTPIAADYVTTNVANLDPLISLNWDVWVKDNNGCTITAPIDVTITQDVKPNLTLAVTNQCTASANSFRIEASTLGVAPYTYTINTGQAPTGVDKNIFTVVAGTYVVTVTDKNGCTDIQNITVNKVLESEIKLIKDLSCANPEEAEIKVDILGGFASFSYKVKYNSGTLGSTIPVTGSSFVYKTLNPGNYEFEITDSKGCITNTKSITVVAPVVVTASETHLDPTCNGFSNGSITLTGLTGEIPFKYSINGGTPKATASFGGLVAGIYTYRVIDAKGCEATGTVTLTDPAAIVATIKANPILCNANTPGSLEVNVASGGTAPYVYKLYDNSFTEIATYTETAAAVTPVHTFAGLNFGDYYITIVDAKGCEFKTNKLRIETPPYLQLLGLIDTNNCATGIDYTVTTSGGTGPYKYSIFGQTETAATASNSHTFAGLLHGVTYFLQVRDSNMCISILEATMPPAPSTINIAATTSTNVSCNASASGTLAFTVQNFDPTVTDIEYKVVDALTLLPLSTPIDGTLSGTAGGPVSGNITNLKAGNYVLQVKEAGGTLCSAAYTFEVTQPAQPLKSILTNTVNATCDNPAQITLNTTGGTGPYTYAVALNPTTPTVFNLGNNILDLDYNLGSNWNILVKDAKGCTFALNTTIVKDPKPEIALAIVNKCVSEGNFEMDVSEVTAGIGAYMISVDGSVFTPLLGLPYRITNLNSGIHTVTIKDANSCTDTKSITIASPLSIIPTINSLPSCANNDGQITLTGSGGTGAGTYTYTINPVAGTITGNTITGLPADTYIVTITDTATPTNCSTTATVTLGAPSPVSFTSTTKPPLCLGAANGSITVILGAGNDNPTYTYEIIAGPQTAIAQSSNVFNGLLSGTYSVKVTSGRGCELIQSVIVPLPAPLTATATIIDPLTCGQSNAAQKATINIVGSGGTGPYEYGLDGINFSSQDIYQTYTAGTFTIYVKDNHGCITSDSVIIDALNPPTIASLTATPVYCVQQGLGDTTSTVTINTTTGTGFGTVTYAMVPPTLPPGVVQTANQFSGLAPGEYTFEVIDSKGCKDQERISINEVTKIQIAGAVQNPVFCNVLNGSNSNGSATFTVTGFSASANYTVVTSPVLPPAQITNINDVITLSGLTANTYTVTVTDNTTGCSMSDSVLFTEPAAITFDVSATNVYCVQNQSKITISNVSGGTGNYSYAAVVSGSSITPVTTFYPTPELSVNTNLTNLVWDVYVKDARGCIASKPITIILDPLPTVTVDSYSQCPDASGKYTVTLTGTGVGLGTANYYYSIGAGYQTSNTFVISNPATYSVSVKDANGCISSTAVNFTIFKPLQLDYTVNTLPSCDVADGSVTLTATGGTTPTPTYEYKQSIVGTYSSSNTYAGLLAGTYTFYVRDVTTGCENSVVVTLKAATPITGLAAVSTKTNCFADANGTITVSMDAPSIGVNDNPIYTFALTGTTITGTTVIRPAQSSMFFNNLEAGTYTVTATSGRKCAATVSVSVLQPELIEITNLVTVPFACNIGTNGAKYATITVNTVIGGSGNYTIYEFIKNGTTVVQRGSSNVFTEANYAGGTYTVNVYDDKNCKGTYPSGITIAPYQALDKIKVAVTTAVTCTNLESVTATAVDNTGATITGITYTLADATGTPLQTNNSGIFTNLGVGNYAITALNPTTLCSIQAIHYVNEPNTFELKAIKTSDVQCVGSNEGAVTVNLIDTQINPSDDAGAFSYVVSGPTPSSGSTTTAGPLNLTGLTAGIYTVSATLLNSPFCSVSTIFTIDQPIKVLSVAETHTSITCITANNNGSIQANATGGWPGGYEYQLLFNGSEKVAYSATYKFTDLIAGNYVVNVKDKKGCIASVPVVLVNPQPIATTVSLNTNLLDCFDDTSGILTVGAVTGGSGNYTYTLSGTLTDGTTITKGPQIGKVFTDLKGGSYLVTVTDDWTCSATSNTVLLNEPSRVKATLIVQTPESCLVAPQVRLTASGGTAPYYYSADGVNYSVSFANSVVITLPTTAVKAQYQYYVKDSKGCKSSISNSIDFAPIPTLNFVSLNKVDIKCKGSVTGSITAVAQGGLGSYLYSLLNSAGNPIVPTPMQISAGNFVNLAAGNYTVKVTSADCDYSVPIAIAEPLLSLVSSATKQDITCNGLRNGKIEVVASGGTGQIKYAISPNLNQFFDSGIFNNLKADTYQVLVQDAQGCYLTYDFEIKQPPILYGSLITSSVVPEICSGDNDAAFNIEIAGGVAPYSVSLDDYYGVYTQGAIGQTIFNFMNISGGAHTVYIKDASGCTSEIDVATPQPVVINGIATVRYDCVNNTQANTITVTYDASNNPADLDFDLDGLGNYQTSNIFENVAPGPHTITVRHTNGCIKTTPEFKVVQVDPLALVVVDGDLNQIKATTTGGAGNYTYSFDGGAFSSNATFVLYQSGIHTVEVRDKNGCTATLSRQFEVVDVCIPNYFTPNGDGYLDTWAPGCTNNYPDLSFSIFDRYGRLIAKYKLGQKWDGKYNGEELPSGDYWYTLKLNNNKDDREFVGHFTLYR